MAKYICLFLSLFLMATAFAQSSISDSLQSKFSQYQKRETHEKLFVQTDKNSYVAGEIVWFKVYDVDAATHKPLGISKVSYVEIVNKENKPVLQAKINMQNGSGSGSFLLPFSINSDNYILKAYTAWMKNFSPDFFFEKNLTIVNTLKKIDSQTGNDTAAYSVQFFPEGGNWVNGIESTVAFKGTNQYGQSMSFSGSLINERGDTLLRFQPFKFGMGKFVFAPKSSEQYKAVIKVNNQTFTQPLPKVWDQGYVMKVSSVNNQLSVSVSANMSTTEPFVYLLVHSQQSVAAIQMKLLQEGKATFVLDKNSLSEGISHLTIFNNAQQPLCERLIYKQPKQQLAISVTPDKAIYSTKTKVELQIDVPNQQAQLSDADLSLSVFRIDSLQGVEASDIFNYLWLSSEMRGNIESPDFYLKDTSETTQEALDNLMLTQGWRRFRWDDVLQNKKPLFLFLPEYEGQIITGTIVNNVTGTPALNVLTYLSIPGEKFRFSSAVSDERGNIQWAVNQFYGAGEAVVQTADSSKNNYRITLNNPFSEAPFYTTYSPFHLSEKWSHLLLQNSIGVQTQNAYLYDERQHFVLSEKEDTTVFYGKPDKRYLLDDYTRFPTMEEVMREYVNEVRLSKSGDAYHYTVNNLPYNVFFKDNPLVLLDGVPVANTNTIVAFNPLLVRQLDVVTRKYFLGNQTYDGIVSYTTYKGDMGGLELNPASIQIEYEGLQLEREFYSPVYETPQQKESRLPDFRNVLYWSPKININSGEKQTISFYTSELEGNFAVTVQGNASNGLAGSKTIFITVKK